MCDDHCLTTLQIQHLQRNRHEHHHNRSKNIFCQILSRGPRRGRCDLSNEVPSRGLFTKPAYSHVTDPVPAGNLTEANPDWCLNRKSHVPDFRTGSGNVYVNGYTAGHVGTPGTVGTWFQ